LIYFLLDVEDKKPYIQEVGDWNGILVGSVDESLLMYMKMPDSLILSEEVALAYKFASKYKGTINVRPNTLIYDQLDKSKLEPYKDKFKYTLTEKDKENACLFHKAAMHFMLNKYYYNKIAISIATPQQFRGDSWKSEHVLVERKKDMIHTIYACKDWVQTGILLNDHFGVQYDPEKAAKPIDL